MSRQTHLRSNNVTTALFSADDQGKFKRIVLPTGLTSEFSTE